MAAAALLFPPSAGAVAPPRGAVFGGGTSDGQALEFRTSADGRRVESIGFASRSIRCASGRPALMQVRFDKRPRVRRGRFAATVVVRPRGFVTRVTFRGRFTSKRAARGTYRQRVRYAGGRRCDTGTLTWTARRYDVPVQPAPQPPVSPPAPEPPAEPPAAPPAVASGATTSGGEIAFAYDAAARTLTLKTLRQGFTCTDGSAYEVTITDLGPAVGIGDDGRFGANLRPPLTAIAGRPLTGSLVELSGAVGDTVRGAARFTAGFADGQSCDGGWQTFDLPVG